MWGWGLWLILYKLAEGERQRRARPIERTQCSSSRMPSIPACCVKVDPAEDLSHVGHLNHTARELGPLRLMYQAVFELHRGCQVPQRLL